MAKVASYASMIPGPIGTIAGVVSAVSYAATGNWKEAAWAIGGAAAAVVGAGAAVKGARYAATAARAAAKARKASAGRKLARAGSKCARKRNSFDGDTPVLMADGSYLPISLVQVGAWVRRATDDQPVRVASVFDRGWVPDQIVYNLNVGDVHTYVVSVDGSDVLVHNVRACGKHGNSLVCTCIHYTTVSIRTVSRTSMGKARGQAFQAGREAEPEEPERQIYGQDSPERNSRQAAGQSDRDKTDQGILHDLRQAHTG
ncbi:hypothetical protein OIE47_27020 [Micromonospora sp. NBC_01796]|nr:hypothetical protein [Micromonospora sp. NBC_01796]WSA83994.1 hypothetical protein OIE47_27020 [Micromonospora sp. NBC_01796]